MSKERPGTGMKRESSTVFFSFWTNPQPYSNLHGNKTLPCYLETDGAPTYREGDKLCSALKDVVHEKTQNHDDDNDVDDDNNDDDDDDNVHTFILLIRVLW